MFGCVLPWDSDMRIQITNKQEIYNSVYSLHK